MLTLLFILFLALGIVSTIVLCKTNEEGYMGGMFVGYVIAFCLLISLVVGIAIIGSVKVQENKLAMYQEENAKLETQIADAVEQYLEHEKQIFVEINPQQVNTYLVAYPELQGSELVKYQLETIQTNNEQIKLLKNDILDVGTWKFLIYFGG